MKKQIIKKIFNRFLLLPYENIKLEIKNPIFRKKNYEILTKDGILINRIYHSHIRKCAGTSFNLKIIGNICGNDESKIRKIYKSTMRSGRTEFNEKVFVGWNKRLIESGKYFYAWSHIPYHQLYLPSNTFVFTTFRDPIQRVFSHYKMIFEYYSKNIDHPCMIEEGKWLGSSKTFEEFFQNMPKNHLMAQLFHYSKSYSIDEAVENINTLDFISVSEKLNDSGYKNLSEILPSLNFPIGKLRTTSLDNSLLKSSDTKLLRELLSKEYILLEKLKSIGII